MFLLNSRPLQLNYILGAVHTERKKKIFSIFLLFFCHFSAGRKKSAIHTVRCTEKENIFFFLFSSYDDTYANVKHPLSVAENLIIA